MYACLHVGVGVCGSKGHVESHPQSLQFTSDTECLSILEAFQSLPCRNRRQSIGLPYLSAEPSQLYLFVFRISTLRQLPVGGTLILCVCMRDSQLNKWPN